MQTHPYKSLKGFCPSGTAACPIRVLSGAHEATPDEAAHLAASGVELKEGNFHLMREASGKLQKVLFCEDPADSFSFGQGAKSLPKGCYSLQHNDPQKLLAWGLGAYRYDALKKTSDEGALLVWPESFNDAKTIATLKAMTLGRNLINQPANSLGTAELEVEAFALAAHLNAKASSIVGDALLKENFPLIHAVGRASSSLPRLVDITTGLPDAPKVTIIGKGVIFDTGGLDIKPSSAMALMKKDMGGAATALALLHMVHAANLPIRLRVLLPIVENAIAGNAFRPGDVYQSRKGLSVEIGDTDAEGRLILADAMALADEEAPDVLITLATLTGAARVALGPDVVPFYTHCDETAQGLGAAGAAHADPLWRMPLWQPYKPWLDSKIADTNSIASAPFAGSITAALFLEKFAEKAKTYIHFDLYAWNQRPRPARPEGGEVQAARAIAHWLEKRFGTQP